MNAGIDTVVTAETPEGIAIVIRPAGIAVRANAFLIDLVIRCIILMTVFTAGSAAVKFSTAPLLIILFVINWLYYVIFELTGAAATPGKRIMGLQVMMANGLPITPAGALIRNLLRAVDALPALYAFAIVQVLLRADARRLGDLAGGTQVVYRDTPSPTGGFADGIPLPPPQGLSTAQQAAIAAFAWRARGLTDERAEEIAALAGNAPMFKAYDTPLTARLVGIARWLHGQRPPSAASGSSK